MSERDDPAHGPRVPAPAGVSPSAGASARPGVHHAEFTDWYAHHHRAVYHYVARTFDRRMAEDLTAATFAEAWRSRHTFDPDRGIPIRWLLGIATNLVKRQIRLSARDNRWLVERSDDHREVTGLADDKPGPIDLVESRELLAFVRAELDREDPATRQMVYLLAMEDMTYQEIADTLDVPIGTVRSRLSRFRTRLDVRMTGQGMQEQKATTLADDRGGRSDG